MNQFKYFRDTTKNACINRMCKRAFTMVLKASRNAQVSLQKTLFLLHLSANLYLCHFKNPHHQFNIFLLMSLRTIASSAHVNIAIKTIANIFQGPLVFLVRFEKFKCDTVEFVSFLMYTPRDNHIKHCSYLFTNSSS